MRESKTWTTETCVIRSLFHQIKTGTDGTKQHSGNGHACTGDCQVTSTGGILYLSLSDMDSTRSSHSCPLRRSRMATRQLHSECWLKSTWTLAPALFYQWRDRLIMSCISYQLLQCPTLSDTHSFTPLFAQTLQTFTQTIGWCGH